MKVIYNVKDTILTESQLQMIFTEIERIVSNRPAAYLSNNISDMEPIFPNHLLLEGCNRDPYMNTSALEKDRYRHK